MNEFKWSDLLNFSFQRLNAILSNELPQDFDINLPLRRSDQTSTPLNLALRSYPVSIRNFKRESNVARSRTTSDLVILMIQHGANPAKIIPPSSENENALHFFAKFATVDLMDQLIPHYDINQVDDLHRTPLHAAAKYNNYDVVRLLLLNGVDIEAKDYQGDTPLYVSLESQVRTKTSLYLLSYGASVREKNKFGLTALQVAVRNSCEDEVIEKLVESGADVKITDESGKTLLHLAVKYDAEVRMLIKCGVDVHAMDGEGTTALKYALNRCQKVRSSPANVTIVESLLLAGAKFNNLSIYEMIEKRDVDGVKRLIKAVKKRHRDRFSRDKNLLQTAIKYFTDADLRYAISELLYSRMRERERISEYSSIVAPIIAWNDTRLLKMVEPIALRKENVTKTLMDCIIIGFREGAMIMLDAGGELLDRVRMANIFIYRASRIDEKFAWFALRRGVVDLEQASFWKMLSHSLACSYPLMKALVRHVAVHPLRSQVCFDTLKSIPELWQYHTHCVEELQEMREMKVCNAFNVTYYQVVKNGPHALIGCLRYKGVRREWESKEHQKFFKVYAKDLTLCYEEADQLLGKIVKFQEVLEEIFEGLFPVEVLRTISEFYNDKEFAVCLKE